MLTVEKQWVNVQQKTFTKWSVLAPGLRAGLSPPLPCLLGIVHDHI
jgi:hypothetical protein